MKLQGACGHIDAVAAVTPAVRRECADCVEIGARTAHPLIASAEPGERWLYCYPDDAFAEY